MHPRRRLMTSRRRWYILGVVAVVGLVAAIIIGHGNRAAGTAAAAQEAPPVGCTITPHSVEDAAVTAIDGLHQLTLANLTPPQAVADKVLERYVTPDRRPLMRQYLAAYPAPYVTLTSSVLAWQPVSFAGNTAVIRIATTDIATDTAGVQKTSQAVTTATLTWNGSQGFWQLADWKVGTANVADVAILGRGVPCDA